MTAYFVSREMCASPSAKAGIQSRAPLPLVTLDARFSRA
jgi:hypothetical protein